jgi:transposase
MICSGDGDIPIFLKLASGNQSDSSCFGQIAVEYQKQLGLLRTSYAKLFCQTPKS